MVAASPQWVTRRAAPRLEPHVERYIGYRLVGYPAGVHRGLPSRHMTFMVSIGSDIDVIAQSHRSQPPQRYGCVIGGLQTSAALIAHDGTQEGVAVELTPVGCRALLGMPARALRSTAVEFSHVVGSAARELWERVGMAAGWEERFAACDDVLSRLLGADVVAPELRHAWHVLVAARGIVSVSDLADTVGWTRQHLARRFGDEFGLSPKLAGRVVRFERARRMLQSTPSFVSIAQVAATCGYYGQAHLTRDCVELAGCSPTRLVADDLLSFQDDTEPDRSG